MQGGDISNEVVPRLLIEFEDLVAHLIEPKRRIFNRWTKRHHVQNWDLDDLVVKVIVDLTWRLHQEIDIITLGGEEFAEDLAVHLDNQQVPYRSVWAYEPRILARRLISMPWVAAVYTARPEHALLYGSRGRLVSPETITSIGRF